MTIEDRDSWIASRIDQLLEKHHNGEHIDLEAEIRQHPDYEQEFRELWNLALLADDLGKSVLQEFRQLEFQQQRADEVHNSRPVSQNPTLMQNAFPLELKDYQLVKEEARGGMGVVYQARQKSLDRIVALKMILQPQWASDEEIERFKREAEAAARLDHPHIVPVYEIGEHQGQPFFSMKYIEGETLSQKLQKGPLPPREAAELLLPVCRAIACAHENGITHRDLKTSNILIDKNGRPYVSDFGLAKRVRSGPWRRTPDAGLSSHESLTRTGAIIGTPSFMSPEQASGQTSEIGPHSDIYSLGAILYSMLTGHPPFQATSPVDTLFMVIEQDPLPPRLLNRNTDPDLEMISLKCLQKPADLRYDSVDALAGDLEAWLNNEPISARSSHFSEVMSRVFRETHHASLLENWGLLWMWHALVLFLLCLITNGFQWLRIQERWPYVGLWVVGLSVWGVIFWNLRRRAGPTTFVERQIAHVWAGSMCGSSLLFGVEWLMNFPVLMLSPILGIIVGTVFLVKAGILSGRFYLQSLTLYGTSLAMAGMQSWTCWNLSIIFFGFISSLCFFLPGLKYYRQRRTTSDQTG